MRGPATEKQEERLRELARWPGMPAEAIGYVEGAIRDGLTEATAYAMIGQMGRRIQEMT